MKKKPSRLQAIASPGPFRKEALSSIEYKAMRDLCVMTAQRLTTAEQQAIIRKIDTTLYECIISIKKFPDSWTEWPWFRGSLHAWAFFEAIRADVQNRTRSDYRGQLALALSLWADEAVGAD